MTCSMCGAPMVTKEWQKGSFYSRCVRQPRRHPIVDIEANDLDLELLPAGQTTEAT